MSHRKAIVWFRSDLRIHDNEALHDALNAASEIYPVYVFDPRVFSGYSQLGLRRVGKHRCKFILESVADLKSSLQQLGSDLIIRIGRPEDVLFELANELKTNWVFCMRERMKEEVEVQDSLEKKIWTIGQEIRYSRGKMLYYTQDLPFPITHVPDTFKCFKKEVKRIIPIRKPLDAPDQIPPIRESLDRGSLLKLKDFGWKDDFESAFSMKGGESNGKELLKNLCLPDNFKGISHSHSYLSAYLGVGCLSPKFLYWKLQKFENGSLKNEWKQLFINLLIRDYFRLLFKKYGVNGLIDQNKGSLDKKTSSDRGVFLGWVNSKTEDPYIDAYMDQLHSTGYLSAVGRQSVAAYLVNHLSVDWKLGAEYFESMLVDYDPCSNWGNWAAVAGMEGAFKDYARFNHVYQTKKEDPNGVFINPWIDKKHQQEIKLSGMMD